MSRIVPAPLRRSLVAAILPCAAFLVGCDDRIEQCNRLVDALNPHTEAVSRAVEALASVEKDRDAPHRLAEAVDTADKALAPLALDDPKLAGWLLAYRRQLQAARKAADAVDAAAGDGDRAALHEAAQAADDVVATQDEILAELNAYCAPS